MATRTFLVERVFRDDDGRSERLLLGLLVLDDAQNEGLLTLRFALSGEALVRLAPESTAAESTPGSSSSAAS